MKDIVAIKTLKGIDWKLQVHLLAVSDLLLPLSPCKSDRICKVVICSGRGESNVR